MELREDAEQIIQESIRCVLPNEAVARALEGKRFEPGQVYLVAVGKAAWEMAKTAVDILGDSIRRGIVLTKYHHVWGELPSVCCYEAGHPVPDQNSFLGTEAVLHMVSDLGDGDVVLFLLSGGGSALFEKPLISADELQDITGQMLACGADIVEMNTIRKRLSAVKGGKFAQFCAPAKVYSIVLSDILGDPLDMIASGPAYPDMSSGKEAQEIVEKYHLKLSEKALALLRKETPKHLENIETQIVGSVKDLCHAAARACEALGYQVTVLTDQLACEAREAGSFLAAIARYRQDAGESVAYIAGGETVVHLTGNGRGGRNQEVALSAAAGIEGLKDTAVFSIGSDGTDGPTDAAGGFVTGETKRILEGKKIDIYQTLRQNNAYEALDKVGGLVKTGPTGTNVNDISVLLIRRH